MYTLTTVSFVIIAVVILASNLILRNSIKKIGKLLTPEDTKKELREILNDIFGNESTEKTIVDLKQEVNKLDNEVKFKQKNLDSLQLEHKQEQIELEFLVVMKERKMELNNREKEVEIESETNESKMKLQKEYFLKTETLLKEHQDKMQKLTDAILSRLPDVSLAINQGIQAKKDE